MATEKEASSPAGASERYEDDQLLRLKELTESESETRTELTKSLALGDDGMITTDNQPTADQVYRESDRLNGEEKIPEPDEEQESPGSLEDDEKKLQDRGKTSEEHGGTGNCADTVEVELVSDFNDSQVQPREQYEVNEHDEFSNENRGSRIGGLKKEEVTELDENAEEFLNQAETEGKQTSTEIYSHISGNRNNESFKKIPGEVNSPTMNNPKGDCQEPKVRDVSGDELKEIAECVSDPVSRNHPEESSSLNDDKFTGKYEDNVGVKRTGEDENVSGLPDVILNQTETFVPNEDATSTISSAKDKIEDEVNVEQKVPDVSGDELKKIVECVSDPVSRNHPEESSSLYDDNLTGKYEDIVGVKRPGEDENVSGLPDVILNQTETFVPSEYKREDEVNVEQKVREVSGDELKEIAECESDPVSRNHSEESSSLNDDNLTGKYEDIVGVKRTGEDENVSGLPDVILNQTETFVPSEDATFISYAKDKIEDEVNVEQKVREVSGDELKEIAEFVSDPVSRNHPEESSSLNDDNFTGKYEDIVVVKRPGKDENVSGLPDVILTQTETFVPSEDATFISSAKEKVEDEVNVDQSAKKGTDDSISDELIASEKAIVYKSMSGRKEREDNSAQKMFGMEDNTDCEQSVPIFSVRTYNVEDEMRVNLHEEKISEVSANDIPEELVLPSTLIESTDYEVDDPTTERNEDELLTTHATMFNLKEDEYTSVDDREMSSQMPGLKSQMIETRHYDDVWESKTRKIDVSNEIAETETTSRQVQQTKVVAHSDSTDSYTIWQRNEEVAQLLAINDHISQAKDTQLGNAHEPGEQGQTQFSAAVGKIVTERDSPDTNLLLQLNSIETNMNLLAAEEPKNDLTCQAKEIQQENADEPIVAKSINSENTAIQNEELEGTSSPSTSYGVDNNNEENLDTEKGQSKTEEEVNEISSENLQQGKPQRVRKEESSENSILELVTMEDSTISRQEKQLRTQTFDTSIETTFSNLLNDGIEDLKAERNTLTTSTLTLREQNIEPKVQEDKDQLNTETNENQEPASNELEDTILKEQEISCGTSEEICDAGMVESGKSEMNDLVSETAISDPNKVNENTKTELSDIRTTKYEDETKDESGTTKFSGEMEDLTKHEAEIYISKDEQIATLDTRDVDKKERRASTFVVMRDSYPSTFSEEETLQTNSEISQDRGTRISSDSSLNKEERVEMDAELEDRKEKVHDISGETLGQYLTCSNENLTKDVPEEILTKQAIILTKENLKEANKETTHETFLVQTADTSYDAYISAKLQADQQEDRKAELNDEAENRRGKGKNDVAITDVILLLEEEDARAKEPNTESYHSFTNKNKGNSTDDDTSTINVHPFNKKEIKESSPETTATAVAKGDNERPNIETVPLTEATSNKAMMADDHVENIAETMEEKKEGDKETAITVNLNVSEICNDEEKAGILDIENESLEVHQEAPKLEPMDGTNYDAVEINSDATNGDQIGQTNTETINSIDFTNEDQMKTECTLVTESDATETENSTAARIIVNRTCEEQKRIDFCENMEYESSKADSKYQSEDYATPLQNVEEITPVIEENQKPKEVEHSPVLELTSHQIEPKETDMAEESDSAYFADKNLTEAENTVGPNLDTKDTGNLTSTNNIGYPSCEEQIQIEYHENQEHATIKTYSKNETENYTAHLQNELKDAEQLPVRELTSIQNEPNETDSAGANDLMDIAEEELRRSCEGQSQITSIQVNRLENLKPQIEVVEEDVNYELEKETGGLPNEDTTPTSTISHENTRKETVEKNNAPALFSESLFAVHESDASKEIELMAELNNEAEDRNSDVNEESSITETIKLIKEESGKETKPLDSIDIYQEAVQHHEKITKRGETKKEEGYKQPEKEATTVSNSIINEQSSHEGSNRPTNTYNEKESQEVQQKRSSADLLQEAEYSKKSMGITDEDWREAASLLIAESNPVDMFRVEMNEFTPNISTQSFHEQRQTTHRQNQEEVCLQETSKYEKYDEITTITMTVAKDKNLEKPQLVEVHELNPMDVEGIDDFKITYTEQCEFNERSKEHGVITEDYSNEMGSTHLNEEVEERTIMHDNKELPEENTKGKGVDESSYRLPRETMQPSESKNEKASIKFDDSYSTSFDRLVEETSLDGIKHRDNKELTECLSNREPEIAKDIVGKEPRSVNPESVPDSSIMDERKVLGETKVAEAEKISNKVSFPEEQLEANYNLLVEELDGCNNSEEKAEANKSPFLKSFETEERNTISAKALEKSDNSLEIYAENSEVTNLAGPISGAQVITSEISINAQVKERFNDEKVEGNNTEIILREQVDIQDENLRTAEIQTNDDSKRTVTSKSNEDQGITEASIEKEESGELPLNVDGLSIETTMDAVLTSNVIINQESVKADKEVPETANKLQRPEFTSEVIESQIVDNQRQSLLSPDEESNDATEKSIVYGIAKISACAEPDESETVRVTEIEERESKGLLPSSEIAQKSTNEGEGTFKLPEYKETGSPEEELSLHLEEPKPTKNKSGEENANDDEEEHDEVDESRESETVSDGTITVSEQKDTAVKIPNTKKHHNLLSGVGSKVKNSISKVKKAITGKSSQSKQQSNK